VPSRCAPGGRGGGSNEAQHERTRRATRLRLVSVFRQGWVALLVALLRQEPLPEGRFIPEPWPAVPAWEEASHTRPQKLLEAA
jgi:hypothetical protein